MISNSIRSAYLRLRSLRKKHRIYADLSLSDTFRRIYRTKTWGDDGERFHSGKGSRGQVAEQYLASVINFIREHRIQSVVDLGCGDFFIGAQIVEATGVRYIGVDVVSELIEHHRDSVHNPLVSFLLADITCDPLPQAELCLIRQVLQHLSNQEIAKVLRNVEGFARVLISEHVPAHPQSINHDKPHGPDIRGIYGSGVYVEKPPFSIPAAELWSFPLKKNSLLRTVLFKQAGPGVNDAVA
jgi:SAM-dependent methyltransferase